MTNSEYVEKTLHSVDRILVDTCSLMSPSFQSFIDNNRDLFLSAKKRILVPHAVYAELGRNMTSNIKSKSERALTANMILASNPDIFEVQSSPLTEDDLAKAFADAELLRELTSNKRYDCQLLITNDQNLSSDAFNLNTQRSCKGKKVFVCYVDPNGNLQCSDCARIGAKAAKSSVHLNTSKSNTINSQQNNNAASMDKKNPSHDQDIWQFDLRSCAIGSVATVGVAGALVVICKSGMTLLRNLK